MQLMPATAEELDVEDSFDPKQNVEAGARLLKSLLERYHNDPALALSAYNAGPERVDQQGGVPAIPETVDYVATIRDKIRSLVTNKDDKGGSESPSITQRGATSTKNSGWQDIPLSLKDF